MSTVGRKLVLLAITVHMFATQCCAQSRAFQWKFGDNFLADELQECQNLTVVVESLTNNASAVGVPPYYLMALELGGVPTTRRVGSNPTQLSWQVPHRQGSALMLTMVDSNGSTGGVSPQIYNVTAGSDTSCLPPAPSKDIAHITSNVTEALSTCEPWGLTITNGSQPYSVILAALDSPIITNVTMPQGYNVFTYINRANPDGQLLAAVVDANGQWGYATTALTTEGSNNTACVGLVSSYETPAQIAAQAAARAHAAAEAAKRHRTNMIAGIVIGVGIPLLALHVAVWWCWRRRKAFRNGIWDGQDAAARAWDVSSPTMTAVPSTKGSYRHVKMDSQDTGVTVVAGSPANVPDNSGGNENEHTGSRPLAESPPPQNMSAPPTGRPRRNRKARDASRVPSGSSSDLTPQLPALTFSQLSIPALQGLSPSSPPDWSRSALSLMGPIVLDPDAQPQFIIQHRDGGVVQEFPPPYRDRSGEAPEEAA